MSSIKKVLLPLFSGLLLTFLFWKVSGARFEDVFWGTWLLTSLLFMILFALRRKFNETRFTTWLIVLSLILRLGLGMATTFNLINWKYDQDHYQKGYLFKDAHIRDSQSWDLAFSDRPIWQAFTSDFFADQYGGLLATSAIIYRFLSPTNHFQINIIFLVAIVNVIGLLFLSRGLRIKEDDGKLSTVSKLILLIYAFYPEAILYSASQMREPLLIGFSAIMFWVIFEKGLSLRKRIFLFSLVSALLLLVSFKIGLFIIFSFLLWSLFQPYARENRHLRSKAILIPIILVGMVPFIFAIKWVVEAGKWDAYLLERSSGFVQYIVSVIGKRFRLPFATLYGLFQPVLPAALIEPAKPFWTSLNSLRALGWYLLMPALIYGLVYFFREKDRQKKWVFLMIWGLSIFWIILSSTRAGGDMWDNPRYRLSFLIFIATAASNAAVFGWKTRDHWLKRIILGEIVFLLFFTQWYLSRYFRIFENLPFFRMVIILLFIFALIVISGIFYEIRRKKESSKTTTMASQN